MKLSPEVRKFLSVCGFRESQIENWTMESELIRDLGQIGDNLFDTVEMLRSEFGIDLSDFQDELYSPGELENDTFLFGMRRWIDPWFPNYLERRLSKYRPITLKMIDDALHAKRWTDRP
jgi:hypothetical protein